MTKALVFPLLLSSLFFWGCAKTTDTNSGITNTQPNSDNSSFYQISAPKTGDKIVIIKTNLGVMKLKLFPAEVKETVLNFETLAKEGKYNGSVFHRIIKDFMIQGGDFERGDGMGGYSYKGPGTTIAEEFNPKLTHIRGALSMAKTPAPHTTGSQFFIVQAKDGTPWLNNQHSVFGQLYEGFEVLDVIANLSTDRNGYPSPKVVMESVTVSNF